MDQHKSAAGSGLIVYAFCLFYVLSFSEGTLSGVPRMENW